MTTRTGSPAGAGADLWRAARDGVVALDVGPTVAIQASGPDARRFCNGMFTNNIRDLAIGGTNRSAMVEDRGRVCGFLDLLCEGPDRFLLLLDGVDGPAFFERYTKYVVFDDVTLEDLAGALQTLSLQGPDAGAALGSVGLGVPTAGTFLTMDTAIVYPRRRSAAGGFDVVVPITVAEAWRSRIGAVAAWAPAALAEVLRVTGGRPLFPVDTGDKRLPHELGLRDELLSFDKGCYLGQESINRIDVMGQVKRQLAGVRIVVRPAPAGAIVVGPDPAGAIVAAEGPPSGAELRAGETVVGELTSPVLLPNGDHFGLAVLKKPADTPGTPVTVAAGGRTWNGLVEALPFSWDG